MSSKPDTAMQPPHLGAGSENNSGATDANLEPSTIDRSAFRAKYDAMFYIAEFIANFQYFNADNPRQEKRKAELKSLVSQARKQLPA